MNVYKDIEQLEDEINKEVLENLKKDTHWPNKFNFNKDTWKDNQERFEKFQESITKMLRINVNEKKRII